MSALHGLRMLHVAGDERVAVVSLSGAIDEKFDTTQLLRRIAPVTILQLDEVNRITSFGVRQWSDAMKSLPPEIRHIYLVGCSPSFVDQLNMVLNFGGRAEVITANGIFFCPKCDDERIALIDVYGDRSKIASGRVGDVRCNVCGGPLQIEDDPFAYLRFAVSYGAKAIDPRAQAVLAETGLYRAREDSPPPEEMKLVHGDVTLLSLSGTLDQRFQPRRLASGVEGEVVFDLSRIEGADAIGCERWARLLGQLKNATQIVLAELPDPLLSLAADGTFTVEGTTLHSVRARYGCPSCGSQIETALAPAMTSSKRGCPHCGATLAITSDAGALERLFARARPYAMPISTAVEEVVMRRAELVAHARAEGEESGRSGTGVAPTRYKLIRQLSQGGMGEILLSVQKGIGGFEKLVALKKIRRDKLDERHGASEMFLAEAKVAANLNHPNIVQIFEIGQQGGDLFIAMEYIHGADVRTILQEATKPNAKPLPLEDVLYIGKQIASALHHAHIATDLSGQPLGIVHRDVSPSNIVIGYDGQVKLVDFGIAAAHSVLGMGGLIGKVSYMSPEQVSGQSLDGRSDVFSLGVVLYELIVRKSLFRRHDDNETTRAVWVDPLPALSPFGVPDYVEKVLLQALERMRDKRYADAQAFEVSLGECLARMRSTVSNANLSLLLKGLFPEQSATPPLEPGTGSGGSKPRSGDYLDVVPVEAETSMSNPGRRPSNPSNPALAPAPTLPDTPAVKPPAASEAPAIARPQATRPRPRSALMIAAVIGAVALIAGAIALLYYAGI